MTQYMKLTERDYRVAIGIAKAMDLGEVMLGVGDEGEGLIEIGEFCISKELSVERVRTIAGFRMIDRCLYRVGAWVTVPSYDRWTPDDTDFVPTGDAYSIEEAMGLIAKARVEDAIKCWCENAAEEQPNLEDVE